MDAKLIEKARVVMRKAAATSRHANSCADIGKGITLDDVLRIFPGAMVVAVEAESLRKNLVGVSNAAIRGSRTRPGKSL